MTIYLDVMPYYLVHIGHNLEWICCLHPLPWRRQHVSLRY